MTADVVLAHVSGQRVLDVGQGMPRLSAWVESRAASTAIVPTKDLVSRGGRVELGLPANEFDLAYCVRTLPHLGEDEASSVRAAADLLTEISRVLRRDGSALIQFNNAQSLGELYHGLRGRKAAAAHRPHRAQAASGPPRLDTLGRFKRMLPATLHLSRLYGMRIFLHGAGLPQTPIVGQMLERFEWVARDLQPLNRLGACLLAEVRKVCRDAPSREKGECDGVTGWATGC